jgi:phosphoribosyl-dephospho-CoA transferase
MEPILTDGAPAPTHDLVRIQTPTAVTANGPTPSWVPAVLSRTPWVVIRRGRIRDGRMPVGVRGSTRSQRFAAWLAVAEIAERRTPEDLWDDVANCPALGLHYVLESPREERVPALEALARVSLVLKRLGYRWGPGGSVGFELATGVAMATASSDLDLILRQNRRLAPDEAHALHAALVNAASPARIDVLLETSHGGVSLAELAATPRQLLVRTPDGVRLMADPWTAEAVGWTEGVS